MTPSLETLTGLYLAALVQEKAAKDNVARIEALAAKHGYTVEQLKGVSVTWKPPMEGVHYIIT